MDIYMLDYSAMVNDSLLEVVRLALVELEKAGIIQDNHFYITFLTNHPDAILSRKLKSKYPEQMTIALQHQFKNLEVSAHHFSVVMSFGGVEEKVTIPFSSIVTFYDPYAEFKLSFKPKFLPNLSDSVLDIQNMPDNVISIDLLKKNKKV